LIPRKRIPTRHDLSDITYPIDFMDSKLYIIPHIRDIMVLEDD
jgi:hypothetical protein